MQAELSPTDQKSLRQHPGGAKYMDSGHDHHEWAREARPMANNYSGEESKTKMVDIGVVVKYLRYRELPLCAAGTTTL